MKILVVHNHYLEKGGEDEVVRCEVEALREHGHEVFLYEKSNERIERMGLLRKLYFGIFEFYSSRNVYKEIRDIVERVKPDIAHIHNIFFCVTPSVYKALKDKGVPVVQSLHNYRLFCLKGTFYHAGAVCERCKNRRILRGIFGMCWFRSLFPSVFLALLLNKRARFLDKIDSFIVTSQFSRDKFAELGLERTRMLLKTNFVNIKNEPNSRDDEYALFLGRLVDYKGVETLLKAFDLGRPFNLKIIGDGPLKEKVQRFARGRRHIEYLGRVSREKVIETIRNSSFLIFPSECYENMPLVIIESFAFSKPVLASNLGAVREFVTDGVNGLLFEPGNPQDILAKTSYLFSRRQERLDMGRRAGEFYRERFDRQRNYQELVEIYSKTVAFARPGLNSAVFTYSLADQDFMLAKSVGVFNVSTQLFENIASRVRFKKINLLANSALDSHLKIPPHVEIVRDNTAVNRLGRIFWDQLGVYGTAKGKKSNWLFLPKGFTSVFKPRGFKLAVYIHDAMHDFYSSNYPGVMPKLENAYFTRCLRGTFKHADVIFTNSDFSRSELERLAADFRIELPPVIVAGIGFSRLPDSAKKKRDSLLLLTSAWPHKLTSQAVAYIKRWQQDTGFSGGVELVGSLPSGLKLPAFKNWRHHQRLSEAEYRRFLAEAKALLFFSRYEGFGMPPVEAMIVGTCPVYSELSVTREVMAGKGFSFANESYDSFASAMDRALKVTPDRIRVWADELLSDHSWEKVVAKVVEGLAQSDRKKC